MKKNASNNILIVFALIVVFPVVAEDILDVTVQPQQSVAEPALPPGQERKALEGRNRSVLNDILIRTPEVAQRMGSMPDSSPIDQRIRAEQIEQEIQQERTAQAYNQRLSEIPNEIHDVILNTMLTDEDGNWLPQMPSKENMEGAIAELRSMYPREVADAGIAKVIEDLQWMSNLKQSVAADWKKWQEEIPWASPEDDAEMLQVIADKWGLPDTDSVNMLLNMPDIYIPTLEQPSEVEDQQPQEVAMNTTATGEPVSVTQTTDATALAGIQVQRSIQTAVTKKTTSSGRPDIFGPTKSEVTPETVANSSGFMVWAQQNPTMAWVLAAFLVGIVVGLACMRIMDLCMLKMLCRNMKNNNKE